MIISLNDFIESYFNEEGIAKQSIIIKCGDLYKLTLNSYIGRGAYNTVFFGKYEKGTSVSKACILKYFLPIKFFDGNEQTDFSYNLTVSEEQNSLIIEKIELGIFSQYNYYIQMIKEYRISNEKMISLLVSDEVNSFIPKPYEEGIFNFKIDENLINIDITNCFMLFAYDSQFSLKKYIENCDSVTKRLKILKSIINIIGVLYYKKSLLMLDIKLDNYIYKGNESVENREFKIIDWDSIIELDESKKVSTSIKIHSSEGFRPDEVDCFDVDDIGIKSSIFMLGACLYQTVFMPLIKQDQLYPLPRAGADMVSIRYDERISNAFDALKLNSGFQMKFFEIMDKCYTQDCDSRYSADDNKTEIKKLSDDVQILIEIYENRGVHPEVMLNKAMGIAKDIMPKDIDENLFTNIKEVNVEN